MRDELLFRRSLLMQLEAASPASLPLPTLSAGAKLAGFEFEEGDIAAALEYLRGKNLVEISRLENFGGAHSREALARRARTTLNGGFLAWKKSPKKPQPRKP